MNRRKAVTAVLSAVILFIFGFLINCGDDGCPTCPNPESEPNVIGDLTSGLPDSNSITLTWTAPEGALEYDIRYSASIIDTTNWASATEVDNEPTPQDGGETELYRIAGLEDHTDYYAAMKFRIDSSDWSVLSNVVVCYTSPFNSRSMILFNSLEGLYTSRIHIVNSDGTNLRTLSTSTGYTFDWATSWTYDGTRILLGSHRDGLRQVYVMDIETGMQTNISGLGIEDLAAHCSPAGTELVLQSSQYDSLSHGLITMRLDGSNRTRLFDEHDVVPFYPRYSFEGTKVVFCARFDESEMNVCTINADGSDFVRFSDATSGGFVPAWSPDGTRIVFQRPVNDNEEIFVMNADGTNLTNISNHPADEHWPDWSPDGTKIVFVSDRDGDYEVFTMDIDGGNVTQITHNTRVDLYPRWSPQL